MSSVYCFGLELNPPGCSMPEGASSWKVRPVSGLAKLQINACIRAPLRLQASAIHGTRV